MLSPLKSADYCSFFNFSCEVGVFFDDALSVLAANAAARQYFSIDDINGLTLFDCFSASNLVIPFEKKRILAFIGDTTSSDHYLETDGWRLIKSGLVYCLCGYLAKESSAEYYRRYIIEYLPQYVYWKDEKKIYLGCNKNVAHFLGYDDSTEVIGKTDSDFGWNATRIEQIRAADQRILTTGVVLTEEEIIPKVDGPRTMLTTKSPLRNKQGKIVGIVGISTDITEFKNTQIQLLEARKQAEAASRAKTAFIENMSHDIRTPLAGIVGAAELIGAEVQQSDISEMAKAIESSGHALLNLLNEILDYSRTMSDEEQPLLLKKFSPKHLCEYVLNLFRPVLIAKGLVVEFDYNVEIPSVLIGDAFRLKHILVNLLSNAVKFTEQGHVFLGIDIGHQNSESVVLAITVKDTGIGMTLEQMNCVYEQFVRFSPSYKGKYRGSGLGLSMVKRFVSEMSGEIDVESEIGVGSCFLCAIPLKKSLLGSSAEHYAFGMHYGMEKVDQAIVLRSCSKEEVSIDLG